MATVLFESINIEPLLKAHAKFVEFYPQAKTELEKMGVLQAFEYCFELSWKTIRKILLKKGIETNSPRDALRHAAQIGMPLTLENWFAFLEQRNLTVHTYRSEFIETIYEWMPTFKNELDALVAYLIKLENAA